MPLRHLALALAIVCIWGVNFAIIRIGLGHFSPLALGVARFVLAVVPWIAFVKRPDAPLRIVALYGLLIFALQFGFLFTGMKLGVSAGLSSLILQLQVFFTIGLSVVLIGERPTRWQIGGALLSFCGIGVVAAHVGGEVSPLGLVLLVLAAASWGGGNIVWRRMATRDSRSTMLGLVVWGSVFAIPPLTAVALVLDPEGFVDSFTSLDWKSAGALAYIVYLSTLFCFAGWGRLLSLYPVATVAPFTLLVPVFGFLGSALLLDEPMQAWKYGASALVIAGLVVNLFGGRIASLRRTSAPRA